MLDSPANVEAIVQVANGWLLFTDPVRLVAAERPEDVRPAIREVERLTRESGWHAVGWVAYEAGEAFGLQTHRGERRWPLVWFALFHPRSVRHSDTLVHAGLYSLGAVTPSLSRASFTSGFDIVKQHIAAGDSYQANFTFRTTARFDGDPKALFVDLVQAQQGRYSAYIAAGDMAVCSASPELFFELDGLEIRTRPMKGTAPRGLTPAADEARRLALMASAKERAENVMIVDMMRNDIGRIAEVGSVAVPALFDLERYPTVWQMTSQVTARSTAPLDDLFAALHPSASVTGAPKVRTMELLAELEDAPRGLYTGAIGHIPPDGNARFNVAIRTAVIDRTEGSVSFGVGSGIVWDSDATAEYDECLLKAAVLGRRPVEFELLETLRWTAADGCFLLDRHLDRMEASARYFGRPWSRDAVIAAIDSALAGPSGALAGPSGQRRVRVLTSADGGVRVEHTELTPAAPLRVALATAPIDRASLWLHHKTTQRAVYDEARASAPHLDDVLLWNDRGEVTESTVANIVIEIDGVRVTPPIECGLLGGTFRAELLARGDIVERTVMVDELRGARIWLINSVYEWRDAEIVQ